MKCISELVVRRNSHNASLIISPTFVTQTVNILTKLHTFGTAAHLLRRMNINFTSVSGLFLNDF